MKLAKILWSLGSLLVNVPIAIYIVLSSKAPENLIERYEYINQNWSIYGGNWKAEFFIMTMITIGALYFAINLKKLSWSIISVGQLILLLTYPIMLGGYRNTPFEMAEMANQMATTVFVFGNVVFLGGLFHLYFLDKLLATWLKNAALVLSGITVVFFALTFVGFIQWEQAMMIGPLVNLLYLINAYYGVKIKLA